MRCPTCGFDNLLGSDICDNCGSDLAGHDTPQSATTFRGRLLGERLDRLKIAPPEIVDASADIDDAIRRMHDKGIDCVLVVEAGRSLTRRDVGDVCGVPVVAGGGARCSRSRRRPW